MIFSRLFVSISFLVHSAASSTTYMHFPADVQPFAEAHEIESGDTKAGIHLKQIGLDLLSRGQYEDSSKVLNQALIYLTNNDESDELKDEIIITMRSIADTKRAMRDIRGSVDALVELLDSYQQFLNNQEVSDLLYDIGTTLMDGRMFDGALSALFDSIEVLEEDDPHRIAESMDFIGECYLKLGRIDDAINTWSESLQIWTSVGRNFQRADTMNSIGVAYFRSGDYSNASVMYESAISIYNSEMRHESGQELEETAYRMKLSQENLQLVSNIIEIEGVAQECQANYHLNGRINQTGSIEC